MLNMDCQTRSQWLTIGKHCLGFPVHGNTWQNRPVELTSLWHLHGCEGAKVSYVPHWQVSSIHGVRCWVNGTLSDKNGWELACCDAQLVNLQPLKRLDLLRQQPKSTDDEHLDTLQ